MADAKALFTQRFEAARTAFAKGDEPAAAECLHSAVVAARSDPGLRRELVSALFHLGKLSRTFGRAGQAEAEPLLNEALALGEDLFGREHAALAPLLNELSRLHIQRSQYARAEEVLERWLAIARKQSEENADVATALAGLAVVKRKLGDDASAEALFRDALRIREKVLEPSHMVTVVTLEQLSETCAARGNLGEALALLRRALSTREVALGPGHPTVQALRARATELELRVAIAADTAAAAAKDATSATVTPARLKRLSVAAASSPSTSLPSPIGSAKTKLLEEPDPPVLGPSALARERAKTPAVTAAVAAASLMASSIQMPSASHLVLSPRESTRPSVSASALESAVQQYDAILAHVEPSDVARDEAAISDSRTAIVPLQADLPRPARVKRSVLYASVGVAAVAIAGPLMLRPRAGGGTAPASAETGAAVVVGAARADSFHFVSAPIRTTAPPAQPAQPAQRAPEASPPDLHLPRVNVHLRPLSIPNITVPSISAGPSVDSTARSAAEQPRASDTAHKGAGERASPTTPADVENAIVPARIIGPVPQPRFPDALLRPSREGKVVVRFMVNELGRVDVASMIVEQSDHELFTAAVRDILPRLRFEPARTRAPESKPVASWVSVPFRFTTKKD